MNPLEQQVQDLEQRITELEQGQNINSIERILQYLVVDTPNTVDASVTLTVTDTVGPDGGTVSLDVLDFPDKWFRVRYNGEIYRLAAYLERLDSSR